MEIERKFTVKEVPADLSGYDVRLIEQAYLCTDPVIRIRKEDDRCYMTYKGKGLLAREEHNLPLNARAYAHLCAKADGNIISKARYLIPVEHPVFAESYTPSASAAPSLTIELDIFNAPFEGLVIAEVEFPDIETANAFVPPDWFDRDVTDDPAYHNSNLSSRQL